MNDRLPCVFVILFLLLSACGGGGSAPQAPGGGPPASGSGGVNDPDKRALPYVILVSFDGFRWDYQDIYDTPSMDRMAAAGIRAASLKPVFPTLTFPNHYSIATGLYPSNHGIVANSFPSKDRQRFFSLNDPASVGDGSWYAGEPAWVAVESSGMVAASFFFVGSEAEIGGIRPTYWRTFDDTIPAAARVDQVVQWLNSPDATRPHFITVYFSNTDSSGHQFGPLSVQTAIAVSQLDQTLGQLLDGVAQSPVANQVYVVLVSDHGMSTRSASNVLILDELIDISGMTIVGNGPYAFLFFDSPDAIRAVQVRDAINMTWQRGAAYLKDQAPPEWNITAESRFPDVIVQADPGFTVVRDSGRLSQLPSGAHGWAPEFADMHGIFLASGPRLVGGTQIGSVSAVDIYPLIMEILEISLVAPIDGDIDALPGLLQD